MQNAGSTLPAEETNATPFLNEQQAASRSAVIQFGWDLTLARARKPTDPGLSNEDAARVRKILDESEESLRAKADELWSTWEDVRGGCTAPDIFTQQSLSGLISCIGRLQKPAQTADEIHAAFRTVLTSTTDESSDATAS